MFTDALALIAIVWSLIGLFRAGTYTTLAFSAINPKHWKVKESHEITDDKMKLKIIGDLLLRGFLNLIILSPIYAFGVLLGLHHFHILH